jgi:hypothetical protein
VVLGTGECTQGPRNRGNGHAPAAEPGAASCNPAPNTPLDITAIAGAVGCIVEFSTWDTPRLILRRVATDGNPPDLNTKPEAAHTHDSYGDIVQLGSASTAFATSQVFYVLSPTALNAPATAYDGVRYLRVLQSLDAAIAAVGQDKAATFVRGSLTFLNGLGLPGKLGSVIKTASEVCSGSRQRPTGDAALAAAGSDVLSGNNADCLTRAIDAFKQLAPQARTTAAAATGPAPAIGMLGIASTWGFDTPQPKDGSFAANLTLQYTADVLPDNPDFDESKLQIVGWDPVAGTFEILSTQLDMTNKMATTHLDHLLSYYSLAMVGPVSTTVLRTPVLMAGESLNSAVALTNMAGSAASARLSAFAVDGTLYGDAANRAMLNVDGGAQGGGTADSLLASGTQPLADWLEMAANQTAVGGVNMLRDGD